MRAKVLGRPAIALFVVLGAVVLYGVTASASGRALEGGFCTTNTGGRLCMALTWDGVEYGTRNRTDLSLRPGTYWLTVNDANQFHNFTLRSCPDSDSTCDSGDVQEIITVPGTPGEVTLKLRLEHGTYRLLCDAANHEGGGMYVDFAVGGVGQVG